MGRCGTWRLHTYSFASCTLVFYCACFTVIRDRCPFLARTVSQSPCVCLSQCSLCPCVSDFTPFSIRADTEERSLLIQSSSASVASTASVDNVGCGESTTVLESAGQHQEICHSHPDKWGTTRPHAACDRVSDETSARMSFSGRFVGGDITDETFLQLLKTESANAFSGGQEKAAHEGDIDDEFFLKLLPDAGHGTLNVLNPPLQHRCPIFWEPL